MLDLGGRTALRPRYVTQQMDLPRDVGRLLFGRLWQRLGRRSGRWCCCGSSRRLVGVKGARWSERRAPVQWLVPCWWQRVPL